MTNQATIIKTTIMLDTHNLGNVAYLEADVRIAYDAVAETATCWDENHLDNNELFDLSSIDSVFCAYNDGKELDVDPSDGHLFDIISGIILEWLFETTEGNNEIEKAIKEDMGR